MTIIASHDGVNNVIKAINKYLIKNISTEKDTHLLFTSLHGKLFAMYDQHKPDFLLWPVSEYTQELQDFITEYNSNIKIVLIVDVVIPQEELNTFLNSRNNVAMIVSNDIATKYRNTILNYGRMYDDEVYHASELERNDKIVALLSTDNDKNHRMLDEIIYPNNKHDHKIVVLNNPEFESPVNLGIFNYHDLSIILKTFKGVLDIDKTFQLEAQVCGIKYFDIDDGNILDAIDNDRCCANIDDISNHTYSHFVQHDLLPHLTRE